MVFVIPTVALFVHGHLTDNAIMTWVALGIYVLVCVTDWLDGYLSRLWKCESVWGKTWDPRADKIVTISLMLVLGGVHFSLWYLVWPAALFIIVREFSVDWLRRKRPDIDLSPTFLAKCKAGVQMVSIGILMMATPLSFGVFEGYVFAIGATAFWSAAVLTVLTGLEYFAAAYDWIDRRVGPSLSLLRIRT